MMTINESQGELDRQLDEPAPMPRTVDTEIAEMIRAGIPLLYIVTFEERRVLSHLKAIRKQIEVEQMPPGAGSSGVARRTQYPLLIWSCTEGIQEIAPDSKSLVFEPVKKDTTSPPGALAWFQNQPAGLFVLADFHPFITSSIAGEQSAINIRKLRDLVRDFRETGRTLIILSPVQTIPMEIEKEVSVVYYPVPTSEELADFLVRRFITSTKYVARIREKYGPASLGEGDEFVQQLYGLAERARGLTQDELYKVCTRSLEKSQKIGDETIAMINEEKRQIIQKSGLLEYFPVEDAIKVGGLDAMWDWLDIRRDAFLGKNQDPDYPMPVIKGILLVGIPGSGKSLSAKSVAAQWQLPLVKLDMGRIYDPLLGGSEKNFERAKRIAASLAPVILWIDEIEKAFPDATSAGDSGVSSRVLGMFLSWMQDKTEPVFVVATANDIRRMPLEMTRKGRFDEIFWVGLPGKEDRVKIFRIHLERWNLRSLSDSEETLIGLADITESFTGAEIEQVIKNALYQPGLMRNPEQVLTALEREINLIAPLVRQQRQNEMVKDSYKVARDFSRPASRADPVPAVAQVPRLENREWDEDEYA